MSILLPIWCQWFYLLASFYSFIIKVDTYKKLNYTSRYINKTLNLNESNLINFNQTDNLE